MKVKENQKYWSNIIDKVKTILRLSGLGMLAAGAGFTVVLAMPKEQRFQAWLVMVVLIFLLVLANMIYAYLIQRLEQLHELTVSIHVKVKEGRKERACPGAKVELYKKEKFLLEKYTDAMGQLTLRSLKLERSDELWAKVTDTKTGKHEEMVAIYPVDPTRTITLTR